MTNSLTIVIPNRNRDLTTVQRSLSSIYEQLEDKATLVVVDYGSESPYQTQLATLIESFKGVRLILCPTQGQLWNKSRSINMVLRTCTTSHFMVCDMDMIWHPAFLKTIVPSLDSQETVYFTVGIMTEPESAQDKNFEDYAVKFQTDHEATGISIFPTQQLISINGFDEYYHGWGSEDTDVHVRLRNAGYEVRFRESELYFKHQWHAKTYRSKESKLPFHSFLERINQQYFLLTKETQKSQTNHRIPWGTGCDLEAYAALKKPTNFIKLNSTNEEVQAAIHFLNNASPSQVIQLSIQPHPQAATLKTAVKKATRKKTPLFMDMNSTNEVLLEALILNHHHKPHTYSYDREKKVILLVINMNVDL